MNSNKGGISFCGLLTIVFIVLKLIGVINWSWLWVLCPLWIGVALFILILSLTIIIGIATRIRK